jgi:hypothetical protein
MVPQEQERQCLLRYDVFLFGKVIYCLLDTSFISFCCGPVSGVILGLLYQEINTKEVQIKEEYGVVVSKISSQLICIFNVT